MISLLTAAGDGLQRLFDALQARLDDLPLLAYVTIAGIAGTTYFSVRFVAFGVPFDEAERSAFQMAGIVVYVGVVRWTNQRLIARNFSQHRRGMVTGLYVVALLLAIVARATIGAWASYREFGYQLLPVAQVATIVLLALVSAAVLLALFAVRNDRG